ncbi:hypothetical protein M8J76_002352 [Diaphorina citri]|nr:hypothetical protein M8J75_014801 [Diaphorina citri]KAI5744446.1 hypothetical protein M8J76_002352 [Diaphorina citri]KAI5751976.1 hypothetical protein M8J77_012629 [Diaphorina citri]
MASTSDSENTPDSLFKCNEQTITIVVINEDGCVCTLLDITGDLKISDLMKKSFLMFNKSEKKLSVFRYNIILVRTGKILRHFQTVVQNELIDGDELLLVERYVMHDETTRSKANKTESPQVANQATIDELTKKLKVKNNKKKKKSFDYKSPHCNQFLIQIELNSVFVALIEMSAKLVRFNDASVVFQDIVKKLGLDVKPDNVVVRKLTDMGYALDISKVALTLKRNNLKEAVEWLATESPSVTAEDIAELDNLDLNFDTVEITADNFSEHITNITKYLMKKEELDLDIAENYLVKIKKMGFTDENEVRRALRKAANEPNHACLLLVGEPGKESKIIDKEDTSAVIVDKIISDPEVLVALSDRNMLIALLDLIDSPDNHVPWPEGSKIETLLMKIVQAFETEKHYLHGCRDIFPVPTIVIYDSDI